PCPPTPPSTPGWAAARCCAPCRTRGRPGTARGRSPPSPTTSWTNWSCTAGRRTAGSGSSSTGPAAWTPRSGWWCPPPAWTRPPPCASSPRADWPGHRARAGPGRPRALPGRLCCAAVTENFDPVAHNRAAWDREVDSGNEWTRPVGSDVIARARAGDWSVVLIGCQAVPRGWFPAGLTSAAVLCLASGGGQQGPVLAAAGADVTVFDNSPRQLGRDEEVAAREGLTIRTVLGDMRDLGAFPDASFDVIVNPTSNVFCPELAPVWRESFRVLRPRRELTTGSLNPDIFIFDVAALDERGEFVVRHPLPFSSLDLPADERARAYGDGGLIEYSHTMTEQIGGQLAAGFVLTHLVEAPHHA